MVVLPEKVFAPNSDNVPDPDLVKSPVPLKTPETLKLPALLICKDDDGELMTKFSRLEPEPASDLMILVPIPE